MSWISWVALAGCGQAPPDVSVEEPVAQVQPASIPAQDAPLQQLQLIAESSRIEWTASKVVGSQDGGFATFVATAQMRAGQPVSVEAEIDLASVFSEKEKLTTHLKSEDFFQVEKFTTARFRSDQFHVGGTGDATHTVTGTLDFHGVVQEISFPMKLQVHEGGAKVQSEFGLDRQKWKISYPGKPDNLIQDEVVIRLDLAFAT
ncbi:MAG: YceI family protein [Myxococcota bacterium]|nr:YceI family protein [Myxococcota bacterium]